MKPGAVPEVKPSKTLLSALKFKSAVMSKSLKSRFLTTVTLAEDGTPELNVDGQLGDLLKAYSDVFPDDLPKGLPPERGVHHTIKLKEGSDPVFRRALQDRLSPLELAEAKQQVLDCWRKSSFSLVSHLSELPSCLLPRRMAF